MQTRYRAAATALLLTATAGLAATGGAAEATGTHHATARAAAKTLTVKITSTKKGPRLSVAKIRPGKTLFKVVRGNSGGTMQVLRLKSGYSLRQANKDFGALFGGGNAKAVRRVDKNVVFYGGMDVPAKDARANLWGVNLDARDTYYVVNLSKNTLTPFTVKGKHQRRALPAATGWINAADDSAGMNIFKTPATNPHKGWMRTTNNATEPHFLALNQVTEPTTVQDIEDYFMSGSQEPPSFALAGATETNVISPGHTFVWRYSVPKGKYAVMCFWPSKTDGVTPHAAMGMISLFHMN